MLLIRHMLDDIPWKLDARDYCRVAEWQEIVIRVLKACDRLLNASRDMLVGAPERIGSEDVVGLSSLDGGSEFTDVVWGRGDGDLRADIVKQDGTMADAPAMGTDGSGDGWPDDVTFIEFMAEDATPAALARLVEELNKASTRGPDLLSPKLPQAPRKTEDIVNWCDDRQDDCSIVAPDAQILSTSCWNSSKEAVLLQGALATTVPLLMLPAQHLAQMGNRLVDAILVIKHRGVVDNMQVALMKISARLLSESNAEQVVLDA